METKDGYIIFLIISIGLLIFLLAMYFVDYLRGYLVDIRYLKSEIKRAYGKKERDYWKCELTALKLSMVPFLSYSKAKKITASFYRKKNKNLKEL